LGLPSNKLLQRTCLRLVVEGRGRVKFFLGVQGADRQVAARR
jgi:hypothetical protein